MREHAQTLKQSASFRRGSATNAVNELSDFYGAFQLVKCIAKGHFGDVWVAAKRDLTSELVAVKIVDKEHIKNAKTRRREVTMLKKAQAKACPFIVELKHSFEDNSCTYLCLELAWHGDLYMNMTKLPSNQFPLEMVRFITAELSIALDWLHQKRIAFRDLKQENVILTRDNHCMLTDFGMARDWEPDEQMHTRSMLHWNPEYFAPEVIREEGHGLPQDFWHLGVLMYEMLVGTTPFVSEDAQGLFVNVLMKAPKFPKFLPADGCDLIVRLLDKDPSTRIGTQELRAHAFYGCYDWEQLCSRQVEPPPFENLVDVVESDSRNNKGQQVAEAEDFGLFEYMNLEDMNTEEQGGRRPSHIEILDEASPKKKKTMVNELLAKDENGAPVKRVSSKMMIQQMSQRASHIQKKILKRKDSMIEQSMQLNLVSE